MSHDPAAQGASRTRSGGWPPVLRRPARGMIGSEVCP